MYQDIPFEHDSVKHSVSEYVRGQVHTNGMESFWSMMKRGYIGIYHKMSPKHLDRYVAEFSGRHNDRESDTADQMGNLVPGDGGQEPDVRGADRAQRAGFGRAVGVARRLSVH